MKRCPRCDNDLSEDKFSKNRNRKDGLQVYCKECRKKIDKKSYNNSQRRRDKIRQSEKNRIEKIKKMIRRIKLKGCSKCSEKEPCAIDFHHITDKKSDIASGINRYSIIAIREELRKCIIVCANCHRKIHAGIIKE
jgi:uncharacterized Zn ribbon protein